MTVRRHRKTEATRPYTRNRTGTCSRREKANCAQSVNLSRLIIPLLVDLSTKGLKSEYKVCFCTHPLNFELFVIFSLALYADDFL